MENQERGQSRDLDEKLAFGLGCFSIGLGVAEIFAPGGLARFMGIPDSRNTRNVLRTYGAREIAAGVALLTQPSSPTWMWGRVAGDLLDLATLARADKFDPGKTAGATAAVLGVTALDFFVAQSLSRKNESADERSQEKHATTRAVSTTVINKPAEEIYSFWRNFTNLSRFMTNVESVEMTGDRRSHWRVRGPLSTSFEWDAETIADEPNSRISWRSVEGSSVYNAGTVRFERGPGGRGTIVKVEVDYDPPGGVVGAAAAKLLMSDPQQQMDTDLRVLKQILETGEIVRSDASIHPRMHAAQPSATLPADSPAMQPQALTPSAV